MLKNVRKVILTMLIRKDDVIRRASSARAQLFVTVSSGLRRDNSYKFIRMGQHKSKDHPPNEKGAVVADSHAFSQTQFSNEAFMALGSDESLYFSRLPPELLRIVFEYKRAVHRLRYLL